MEQEGNLQSRDTYVNALATSIVDGQSLKNVPGLIKKIIKNEMWRERIVHQTKKVAKYKRFIDFVQDYAPEGLHTTIDLLIDICENYKDMEAVSMLAEESTSQGYRSDLNNIDNNVMDVVRKDAKQGNSTAYTMRRLAKDFPSIHAEVIQGKMTPNKAALSAGFRKRKIQLPEDASAAGRYLAQRVDAEWMLACYDAFMKSMG